MKYAISACLCGVNCKYNGGNNFSLKIKEIYDKGDSILICPEVLGGLTIPRKPFEIREDRVINTEGIDCTEHFTRGAFKALGIIKEKGITKAILKENSPSCGVNHIYDGTFSNKLIEGKGITTRLLVENGIDVVSELCYEKK